MSSFKARVDTVTLQLYFIYAYVCWWTRRICGTIDQRVGYKGKAEIKVHILRVIFVVKTRLNDSVFAFLLMSTAINRVRLASTLCIGSINCSILGFFLSRSYTDTRPTPSASGTNNHRPPSTKWNTAGVAHLIGRYLVGSCFSFLQPSSTESRVNSQRSSSSAE